MKVRVKWIENVAFVGETESSHAIVMDGSPEGGGRNLGPRPMETVLAGTGGCTAYDVVTILKKARQDITDCVVEIDADRAHRRPQGIHPHPLSFHHHRPQRQARACPNAPSICPRKSIARLPSCSARTAEITHDFEIVER